MEQYAAICHAAVCRKTSCNNIHHATATGKTCNTIHNVKHHATSNSGLYNNATIYNSMQHQATYKHSTVCTNMHNVTTCSSLQQNAIAGKNMQHHASIIHIIHEHTATTYNIIQQHATATGQNATTYNEHATSCNTV